MSRIFASALLFLMLGIFLSRDASQPDGELELALTAGSIPDKLLQFFSSKFQRDVHERKSVTTTRMSAYGGKAEVDFRRLHVRS